MDYIILRKFTNVNIFKKLFKKVLTNVNNVIEYLQKSTKEGENEMANRTVMIKDLEEFISKIVEKGFSYRQLALKTGCSQTLITLLTKGERNPSPEIAVNICKALGCKFDEIFFIKGIDKSQQG